MFELSVAWKYLIPRRKRLSLSLVALLSVGVISLVVWLLLVFLSVTDGMEKRWLSQLTRLHAPLRIHPTDAYYQSYYYQIDRYCVASHYETKTIGEKAIAPSHNPYQAEEDAELPSFLGDPEPVDPVKAAYQILTRYQQKLPGFVFQDYETAAGLLRLQLLRIHPSGKGETQGFLTQASYLRSFASKSSYVSSLLLKPRQEDLANQHFLTNRNLQGCREDRPTLLSSGSAQNDLPSITFSKEETLLPIGPHKEVGILLAKSFQEAGVRIADPGYLSYTSSSGGSLQEQRVAVFVAGFYDPGVMAVGNKVILAPISLVRTIQSASTSALIDPTEANGIAVWFPDLGQAKILQQRLMEDFTTAGIAKYWNISSFYDYDFAKGLLQQFHSDRLLFLLIGAIILIVACCNIISQLVLLVHDKKREIAILRALGAPTRSIALIFSLCGALVGLLSSLIGLTAALCTLQHIDTIAQLLSALQGHAAFNPNFYGESLPDHLSTAAVRFILIATPVTALLAGLIPAIQACRLQPSPILRSE